MRNHLSDLRGAGRLAIDATHGITDLVEALHHAIAGVSAPVSGPLIAGVTSGITTLVYKSIRGVTRVVGSSLDAALGVLAPAVAHVEPTPEREALLAVLNGVLGDYLADTRNPLALPMTMRREGRPLSLVAEELAGAIPAATGKVLVLAHGLCMNDRQWQRGGHDHGAALARDLGYTPVYLRYNSGLHVSNSGLAFANLLETLVAAWPVPVTDLTVLAHSMGGLVARSADLQARRCGHAWPSLLRSMVFLGTPHHGAPLERIGNWIHRLLAATPYTEPFSRLGRVRSAGITDLRHGCLLDADWAGHDRFAARKDPRQPAALPDGVRCFTIAGALATHAASLKSRAMGDGLVPVDSALGRHRDPRFALAFPRPNEWVAEGVSHLDLLSRSDVYERLRSWLRE